MRKSIIIRSIIIGASLVAGGAFLSCGKHRSGYYPKDQWIIPNQWFRHPLKGEPLEVKESFSFRLEDTTLETKDRPSSWELCRFDRDGNMVYKEEFYADDMRYETFFTYDSAGSHFKAFSHGTRGLPDELIGTDRSTLLPIGKIRVIERSGSVIDAALNANQPLVARLTSFSNDGNIKKVEWMKDTSGEGEPTAVATSFYEGQKLQKIEGRDAKEHVILQYYYSSHDFLDSIISDSAGKTYERQLYINNSFGDPVRYLDIKRGKDTVEEFIHKYEYDSAGNWTRRLQKRICKDPYESIAFRAKGKSAFTLFVRDIVYPQKTEEHK